LTCPEKVVAFNDALSQHPFPESYSDFVRVIKSVADEVIPTAVPQALSKLDLYCHSLSSDSDVVDILRSIIAEEKKHRSHPRRLMLDTYKAARDQLLETVISQLTQLSEAGQQRKAWHIINGLAKRHQQPGALVTASSIPDRLKLFHDHFHTVLNQPPAPPQQLLRPPDLPPIDAEAFNCGPFHGMKSKLLSRGFPNSRLLVPMVFPLLCSKHRQQ
jgi:hypothetical protein